MNMTFTNIHSFIAVYNLRKLVINDNSSKTPDIVLLCTNAQSR